jgi:hypothetical protein
VNHPNVIVNVAKTKAKRGTCVVIMLVSTLVVCTKGPGYEIAAVEIFLKEYFEKIILLQVLQITISWYD